MVQELNKYYRNKTITFFDNYFKRFSGFKLVSVLKSNFSVFQYITKTKSGLNYIRPIFRSSLRDNLPTELL